MAKKLSTLIIDAVINTSQIDQAANRINQKLGGVGGRSGRGGYGGGYGGPSGGPFTGGRTPYGFAVGNGGGGSGASVAMGAAFGAAAGPAAAERIKSGFNRRRRQENYTFGLEDGRIVNRFEASSYKAYSRAERRRDRLRQRRDSNPDFINQVNAMDAEIEFEQELKNYDRQTKLRESAQSKYEAVQRGMRRRARGTFFKGQAGLLRGAGIAGGALAAVNMLDAFQQEQANMDEYNYIGNSAKFNVAKSMRQRYDEGQAPNRYMESFALGANIMGQPGAFATSAGFLDDMLKTSMTVLAAAPEIVMNPFAAFAAMEVGSTSTARMVETTNRNAKRNTI